MLYLGRTITLDVLKSRMSKPFYCSLKKNHNIGCIEMLESQDEIFFSQKKNHNIGCIEMPVGKRYVMDAVVKNHNIGCIEMG